MITHAKAGISKKKKKKLFMPPKITRPHTFQQAFKDPNWVTAMKTEYTTLM